MTIHEIVGTKTKIHVAFLERIAMRLETEARAERYNGEPGKRYALLTAAGIYRLRALHMRQVNNRELTQLIESALGVGRLYEAADEGPKPERS